MGYLVKKAQKLPAEMMRASIMLRGGRQRA
jgi:hypothetical protein